MVSFTLDAVKFLLIYRYLQNIYRFKRGNTSEETTEEVNTESKIVTTEEELDAYRIVKAICRKKVDISRIVYRDAQTYFSILLDDNNRKPICRMYFNTATKYVATIDENKKDVKHVIETLDDIYNYEDDFFKTIDMYEHKD